MNRHLRDGLSIYAFTLFATFLFAYALQGVVLTAGKIAITLAVSLAMGALWGIGTRWLAQRKGAKNPRLT